MKKNRTYSWCRCIKKNEKGFSLAEVLVTIIIFAIATVGLTVMMVSMVGSNDSANRLTEAVQMAEDKLEELKNECCLLVEPGSDTVGEFTRTWNFVDNVPVVGLLKVTITVGWLDHKGHEHSTMLAGLMLPP